MKEEQELEQELEHYRSPCDLCDLWASIDPREAFLRKKASRRELDQSRRRRDTIS